MAGRLEGKVAFITGAARGQGRSHAMACARKAPTSSPSTSAATSRRTRIPLATPEDLAETERSVKEVGRRVVAKIADVRERHELRDAVEAGVADLGKIDIVVANAGILPMAMGRPHDAMAFVDASRRRPARRDEHRRGRRSLTCPTAPRSSSRVRRRG